MIVFHNIRYKNFQSVGNVWNEYQLDNHPNTLIIGKNGAGKTTLLDALCFVLYGKPFRDVKKATIVNTINMKQMLVEVEFTTQGHRYLIRRGLKPTVFDVLCDGVLLPDFPSVIEMQEFCEKYILKCNFKAFTQVVILGASSYVPFMRLTPAARREILEDVLDIEVFSVMQALAKTRMSGIKDGLDDAHHALKVIESQHALARTYADQWVQQQAAKRERITAQLATQQSALTLLTNQRSLPVADEDAWKENVARMDEWQAKHTKAAKLVTRFDTERQHLEHSHAFFRDHDQCPTCTQIIDPTFKSSQITTATSTLATTIANRDEAQRLLETYAARLATGRQAQRELSDLELRRHRLDEQIKGVTRDIQRLTAEYDETLVPPPAPPTELGDLTAATQAVSDHQYQKHLYDETVTLLKDTGIKTRIIQQYLPAINQIVNEYLQALNFAIQFTLDDQFTETIKSRHRDTFSYENFSEGEKRRIDFALILTWREIAKMKNSVHTNLIVFDEIFDSSLDAEGSEDVMNMVHSMGAGTNVVVISHKTELLIDHFSHVVSVSRDRGFSVLNDLSATR